MTSIVWTGDNDAEVRDFCGSTLSGDCWADRPAFEVIDPGRAAIVWTGHWTRIRPGTEITLEENRECQLHRLTVRRLPCPVR